MTTIDRRRFLAAGAGALLVSRAAAQADHGAHHEGQYESLRKPGRIGLPEIARTQHVFDSPAPKADRWEPRAPMPTGRDHTGTLVVGGLIHVVGGRVDSSHTNSNLHMCTIRRRIVGRRGNRYPPRVPAMVPCSIAARSS